MKSLKKITLALILVSFIFLPYFTFAQEEEKTTEEIVETTTSPAEQLDLELPDITDNPSLIITFTDPSTEKKGVHLEIDKKGFVEVKSPYTFPALSIGNHEIKFKFVDKYGATQTFAEELIIIPRAPLLNTPSLESTKMTLSGSALAGSEVVLLLSSDQKMITETTKVDEDGKWQIEITESMPTGMYSFTAFARKYGYASNLAQSMTMDVTNGQKEISRNEVEDKTHFAFSDINGKNIKEVISENPDLLITIVASLVLGVLLGLLFSNISHKSKENKEVERASKSLEKPSTDEEKPMTLRDKLISKEVTLDEQVDIPIEEEVEQEPVVINEIKGVREDEEEKVITKIDFLKNFKHEDPDNEEGKEKKIKVSLTSKK